MNRDLLIELASYSRRETYILLVEKTKIRYNSKYLAIPGMSEQLYCAQYHILTCPPLSSPPRHESLVPRYAVQYVA